jgi:phospholipid/cholesterol/gamma-HCH transport system ATP-binding protein
MESGDHIVYMHQGRKRWEGSSHDIVFSEDKDLNAFIFASEFLQKAKEMTVMEEQDRNPEGVVPALPLEPAPEKPKRKGLF